jgi:hypothetical protein
LLIGFEQTDGAEQPIADLQALQPARDGDLVARLTGRNELAGLDSIEEDMGWIVARDDVKKGRDLGVAAQRVDARHALGRGQDRIMIGQGARRSVEAADIEQGTVADLGRAAGDDTVGGAVGDNLDLVEGPCFLNEIAVDGQRSDTGVARRERRSGADDEVADAACAGDARAGLNVKAASSKRAVDRDAATGNGRWTGQSAIAGQVDRSCADLG